MLGPVLEEFERIPSCSHGLETQRPWAFNDAPVSNAICVHVVLALHPGQSRSPKVPGRTRTVAVRKKINQRMSAGSAISFFGFNIISLYECLSLVIVSCSMQVKVRCKVVWQVVPNSSIQNMLKSRSVARSSGRLCQLHQYITCGITKNAFSPRRNTCFFISCTRIRGFLVFELTSKQYRSN